MKRVITVIAIVVAMVVSLTTTAAGITPAAPAQPEPSVYVVAVGDIACDPSPKGDPYYASSFNNGQGTKDGCRQAAVGEAVMAAKPDQFWALGDIQYFDGTYEKFMAVYDKAFGPLKPITQPIPGNHEWLDFSLPKRPGLGYFAYYGAAARPETNGTYSFDVGDWHVLAINDNLCNLPFNPCGPGSSLAKWIASDMAANTKPCTAAMWHRPLWSAGATSANGYGPMVPVWNQLLDLGVDIVLTGHDHLYVRTVPLGRAVADPANPEKVGLPTYDPDGMVQFVLGMGGEDNFAEGKSVATILKPFFASYAAKRSPGLFGATGFRLYKDRYTFSYLAAKASAPFQDTGGRTCRRASNGNPEDIPGEPVAGPINGAQRVTWTPRNTTVVHSLTNPRITPTSRATTSGDGEITYAVTSPGTTRCTVDRLTGVVSYVSPGQCEVTATAAGTPWYGENRASVVFAITLPPTSTPRPSAAGGSRPSSPSSSSSSTRPSTTPAVAPRITSVQPPSGPIAGGTTITLTGTALGNTSRVTIAGRPATFSVINDTTVTVEAPAATKAGAATISLTAVGSRTPASVPNGYTYEGTPSSGQGTTSAGPNAVDSGASAPGNPEAAAQLAPGIVLVSREDAADVSATVLRKAPAATTSAAPRVRVRSGATLALVVGGQPAGQTVTVEASLGGAPLRVGSAVVDGKGWLRLPALSLSRPGPITLRLVSSSTGKPRFVRLVVSR